jgi:Ca2+-transporting ATPase
MVLDLCTAMLDNGQIVSLSHAMRGAIIDQNRDMAGQALRVLGVAFRPLDAMPSALAPEEVEHDLVFVGLLGMIDPPRPEVIEALKVAKGAGLKTVMVTGDYKDTAEAIARDIGLRTPGGLVLTGAEIDKLSDTDLADRVDRLDVCCRVSPQHKTRIVEAFKARDHVVAMTGDGVNDAPALKRANIGIAMGITGTDVAKQTADMVLTDDNFASIVSAIEQGRIIYSNIRKFVYFLLACNVGEILIVFGAMLIGLPMPLRPVQLLWLNLVSDGAPALALGLEKGDDDIMKQPARSSREPVINRDMALGIGVVGVVDMLAILGVFWLAMQRYPGHIEAAQTIAFVTLCTSELIRAFAARSEVQSVFSIGVFSNRWMVAAVAVSFCLVLAVVYVPFLAPFFDAVPLGLDDWLLMLPFFFASPIAMELLKFHFRLRQRARRAEPGPAAALPTTLIQPGGHAMKKLLVAIAGNANDTYALQEVVRRFKNDRAMEVHLAHVEVPFSADVAHHSSRESRQRYHHDSAEKALAPAREMLDKFSIPYAQHVVMGDPAGQLTGLARRLHCDEIVMATRRKNALTRLIEQSVTDKVVQITTVPVEVVPGAPMSGWERYGIPAALGAALVAAALAFD